MPQTKKDIRLQKNKKLDAAGLRAPLTKSGVPVKAAKESYTCATCKVVFQHINQTVPHLNKHPKNTYADLFPGVTQPAV
ncbi:hypothetical protein HDU98_000155 [Podochytrium sp. JEL0797]|nr:hypothetical protein HDU98_000155 [Podochytrium sp. JEL0797]